MRFEYSWLLIPLWMALFILDDYLTVVVAKRYDEQNPALIEFEGGYELTPQYKEEIAAHHFLGPLFRRTLIIFTLMLVSIRYLTSTGFVPGALFTFLAGAAILLSCSVNLRHIQNLVFFGLVPVPDPPRGRITYPASFNYRGSAVSFLAFGAFCLLLGTITWSWFFIGGTVACVGTGLSHWRHSKLANSHGGDGSSG